MGNQCSASLQLICCQTDKWYHKKCLKKEAFSLQDDFKCPSCGDVDMFRGNMQDNGIYIPQSCPVAEYNSFREVDDVTPSAPLSKRRRVHKNWILETTFENKKEAEEFKTFLKKLNNEKFGEEKINCGTLEKWLDDNSSVPDDESKPFVLKFEMNCENVDSIDFRFFVTTKLLLKQAIDCIKIHADATYKIIWQGFPLLLVGTTDLHRSFHPFGVAICTSEQQKDFEFIFTSLKNGVEDIFDQMLAPKFLVADAAKSIHNAAKKVFGDDLIIIMCWFHMRKAVLDKLPTFVRDEAKQKAFISGLDRLQLAKTRAIFEAALPLFIDKWKRESSELTEYFMNQWIHQNTNWFEGVAKLVPSTNNALESNNRIIKDEHTLRERMDLGKFRVALFDMLNTWSIVYASGQKSVQTDAPELTLKLWTEGYRWAKENVKITSRRNGRKIIYRTSFTEAVDDANDWPNFDTFKHKAFCFNDTCFNYPISRENWLSSECDCEDFFKLFMCRHIIGIALRMRCIAAPAEAKTIPIGQKRKRGRPAKARGALVRQ